MEKHEFNNSATDVAEPQDAMVADSVILQNTEEGARKGISIPTQLLPKKQYDFTGKYLIKDVNLTFKSVRVGPEEMKNHYDCRILIDSFFTILNNQSWKIEFKNYGKSLELEKKLLRIIAVLGHENKGKTFILSKIMGYDLPQGHHTHTKGVCVLYPSDKSIPWAALDTPGTDIPIRMQAMTEKVVNFYKGMEIKDKPDEILRRLLGDNILIETLVQTFIINHADVILITVGKLHRDDQRMIARILREKIFANKRVFIVHNLKETEFLEDAKRIIESDILECFKVVGKQIYVDKPNTTKNNIVYLEVFDESTPDQRPVEHLIIAHEGSEAGRFYNQTTIEYIRNAISHSPHNGTFNLVESFMNHINSNLQRFLHPRDEKPTPKPIKLHCILNDQSIPSEIKFLDQHEYDLKLSSSDEFGHIKTFTKGILEPCYTLKWVTRGEERYIQLEIEVSGELDEGSLSCTFLPTHSQNSKRIEFTAKILDNVIEKKSEKDICEEKVIDNNRKFGSISIITEPIDLEGFDFDLASGIKIKDMSESSRRGLVVIQIPVRSQKPKIIIEKRK